MRLPQDRKRWTQALLRRTILRAERAWDEATAHAKSRRVARAAKAFARYYGLADAVIQLRPVVLPGWSLPTEVRKPVDPE